MFAILILLLLFNIIIVVIYYYLPFLSNKHKFTCFILSFSQSTKCIFFIIAIMLCCQLVNIELNAMLPWQQIQIPDVSGYLLVLFSQLCAENFNCDYQCNCCNFTRNGDFTKLESFRWSVFFHKAFFWVSHLLSKKQQFKHQFIIILAPTNLYYSI